MSLHREIPEGYEIEWRPDRDFEVFVGIRECSFKNCHNPAIAILYRAARVLCGRKRQYCCKEHMYGREIRLGKVMIDCLKPREGDNGPR
jgi:hypothetical protein